MYSTIAGIVLSQCQRLARATARRLDGQSMVEYALLLMLVGTMAIIVLVVMGNQVHNVFNNVSCMLGKLGGACAPPPPD